VAISTSIRPSLPLSIFSYHWCNLSFTFGISNPKFPGVSASISICASGSTIAWDNRASYVQAREHQLLWTETIEQRQIGVMLSSGAHAIQERRNRRAAVRKAALSSRVSLLSGITASSSGGSSGSGSTITQESVSRPRVESSRDHSNSKGKRQRATASSTSTKGKNSPRKSKGVIDVFAFLEKDGSRVSLAQQRARSGPNADQDGTKCPTHYDSDLDSDPRSFNSDSGISINDVGSDHDSPKMTRAFGGKLGTLQEEQVQRNHRSELTDQGHHPKLQTIPQDVSDDHPERYYWTIGSRDDTFISATMNVDAASERSAELKPSGYDLLASRLCSSQGSSEDSLPPIYRRFESLNHRIFLQLQDEIAEMEEDLQHMDRADAFQRAAQHGEAAPASRRLDWQWRGSELHARRLELLGRIYLKVEQFSKSFSHESGRGTMLTEIKIKPSPHSSE